MVSFWKLKIKIRFCISKLPVCTKFYISFCTNSIFTWKSGNWAAGGFQCILQIHIGRKTGTESWNSGEGRWQAAPHYRWMAWSLWASVILVRGRVDERWKERSFSSHSLTIWPVELPFPSTKLILASDLHFKLAHQGSTEETVQHGAGWVHVEKGNSVTLDDWRKCHKVSLQRSAKGFKMARDRWWACQNWMGTEVYLPPEPRDSHTKRATSLESTFWWTEGADPSESPGEN